MEILAKLGIDWKLFIAQIVNFAILFWILRRFAYRPMLAFLAERTERIDKGLSDADAAHKKLGEMEQKEREMLEQAKKEAQKILEKAERLGKQNYEKMLEQAKEDVDRLMKQSELKMESEKAKLLSDAKAQLAELVVLTTEKVLQEKIDAHKDSELIQKHLKSLG
ncbi:MAG: F0F1 ATP synthase subunit B [Candidatus Moranbacteria bacterium]|nr:F0F1 ATP synthase subunit B [Candidatus Moranbacteria bacterium]